MKEPKQMEISAEDKKDLIKRVHDSNLPSTDQELLTGLIEFNQWLQFNVQEKNISISRLQKLFGNKSEKKLGKKKKGKRDKDTSAEDDTNDGSKDDKDIESTESVSEETSTDSTAKAQLSKNSGRLSHTEYPGAEIVPVTSDYKVGDDCPEECGGKLKSTVPGVVIKITGQSMAKATKYILDKLRCNLCDKYFVAKLPLDVSPDKYDAKFKAHLGVYKHYLGVPNYRLEGYQQYLGVPLPDSTQWDKTEELANDIHPIFKQLEIYAANGYLTHGDDTGVKILSVIKENKEDEDKKRKGTFTTGFVSYYKGHKIHMFKSGRSHAGENIKELLDKRSPELPRMMYVCDALNSNMPKGLKAIIINCLVHGRRGFVEIEKYFPEQCSYVIDVFSEIYKNETETKSLGLTDKKRLLYHRKHSRPQVKRLYQWLIKQLREELVEENNSLGRAIKYMLRHVKRLTKFLRVPGAPLDNNIVEQSLKLAIRVRKNSLFYATGHGAYVGSMLQSIIYTCMVSKQNVIDYLTVLQECKIEVRSNPEAWMPWNYLETKNNQQLVA